MSEEDQPRIPQQIFDPPSSSENPKKLISAQTPHDDQINQSPEPSHDRNDDDGDKRPEEDCFQTPTSSEHRIPTVQGCPAPPRKSRPKRKLDDADRMPPFMEEGRREEVESFFRVNNDDDVSERESRVRSRSAKRRCRSI